MKYITAFEVIPWIWKIDYSECMDCKYPYRWDKIRKEIKKFMNK